MTNVFEHVLESFESSVWNYYFWIIGALMAASCLIDGVSIDTTMALPAIFILICAMAGHHNTAFIMIGIAAIWLVRKHFSPTTPVWYPQLAETENERDAAKGESDAAKDKIEQLQDEIKALKRANYVGSVPKKTHHATKQEVDRLTSSVHGLEVQKASLERRLDECRNGAERARLEGNHAKAEANFQAKLAEKDETIRRLERRLGQHDASRDAYKEKIRVLEERISEQEDAMEKHNGYDQTSEGKRAALEALLKALHQFVDEGGIRQELAVAVFYRALMNDSLLFFDPQTHMGVDLTLFTRYVQSINEKWSEQAPGHLEGGFRFQMSALLGERKLVYVHTSGVREDVPLVEITSRDAVKTAISPVPPAHLNQQVQAHTGYEVSEVAPPAPAPAPAQITWAAHGAAPAVAPQVAPQVTFPASGQTKAKPQFGATSTIAVSTQNAFPGTPSAPAQTAPKPKPQFGVTSNIAVSPQTAAPAPFPAQAAPKPNPQFGAPSAIPASPQGAPQGTFTISSAPPVSKKGCQPRGALTVPTENVPRPESPDSHEKSWRR